MTTAHNSERSEIVPDPPTPTWAIRLRLRLLLPFDCRWNAWVRDATAKLERPNART